MKRETLTLKKQASTDEEKATTSESLLEPEACPRPGPGESLADYIPADDFVAKICGSDEHGVLDGLSRILTFYVHYGAGRTLPVEEPGVILNAPPLEKQILRSLDPRTQSAIMRYMIDNNISLKAIIKRAYAEFVF